MRAIGGLVAITGAFALLVSAVVVGQQTPPPGPPPQDSLRPPDTTQLVHRREVFSYPEFQRRNPFTSLVGGNAGPRYEGMRLLVTLVSDTDPSRSIATITVGGGSPEAPPMTRQLRVGERWGNVVVREIRQEEILVDVEEFGQIEARIMRLTTRGQGGS